MYDYSIGDILGIFIISCVIWYAIMMFFNLLGKFFKDFLQPSFMADKARKPRYRKFFKRQ